MKLFPLGCALIVLTLILLGLYCVNRSKEMQRWQEMCWQERWEQMPKHEMLREMVEEK